MDLFVQSAVNISISVSVYTLMIILIFLGYRVFYQCTRYSLDELIDKDNSAFGITISGYIAGISIAVSGAVYGVKDDYIAGLGSVILYGVASIILMNVSIFLNNKLVLYKFNVHDEIGRDKNFGAGFVVGGHCVASGLIISGALSGESSSYIRGIIDLSYYWALGQAFFFVAGILYQKITSYDFHELIERNNNAAGVVFGSFLISVGLIGRAGLAGAGGDLAVETIISTFIMSVGVVILIGSHVITDKVFIRNVVVDDEIRYDKNMAVAVVSSMMYIMSAIVYSSVIY